MFSIPRVNVTESDAGFSIEVLGRTGMKYREGKKALFIDSEVLAPGKGIAIFAKSIRKWDPPYEGEPIDPAKKRAIVSNIRKALSFRSETLEVL
jgi:hypothetical protein